MENLIPVINKLQDAFASVGLAGLDLPQIAVIGSQSSGKSSVLESIVGRDFLPRGSGIVTRRPLVLQLNHVLDKKAPEYGVFLHNPTKKFYDFQAIRQEIQLETDRMTGQNKGISRQPINLKIYSPNVISLTLIDLPGVTKIAVGDQPPDIEIQIRDMVMEYIEKESCLILAVSPANSDIANSDALQLARLVDPDGDRTIGVLTKLDLMDEGTDAMDILSNKLLALKHGFVGVVNRSQKEIDSNKDVSSAAEKERQWFATHPVYSSIKDKCGTAFLREKLRLTLIQHIQQHMPTLKHRLNTRLSSLQKELASLNAPFKNLDCSMFGGPTDDGVESLAAITEDPHKMQQVLMNIVRMFSATVKQLIDGHDGDIGADAFNVLGFITGSIREDDQLDAAKSTDKKKPGYKPFVAELNSSVRIKYLFQEVFPQTLISIESILLSSCMDDEIRTIIHNARGLRAGLFIPDAVFEILIKRHIMQLEMPALECVDTVHDELIRMIRIILDNPSSPVRSFPQLQEWMMSETNNVLDQCKLPTIEEVKRLIQMEVGFINTGHPDFLGKRGIGRWLSIEKKKRRENHHYRPLSLMTKRASGMIAGHKEGYLTKLGGTRKNWKKRWFVLRDDMIEFFESAGDKTSKASFTLNGVFVRDLATQTVYPEQRQRSKSQLSELNLSSSDDSSLKGKQNVFVIFSGDKSMMFRNHATLYLCAESEQEKKDWIRAITQSIEFAQMQAAEKNSNETVLEESSSKKPPVPPRNPPPRPDKPRGLRPPSPPQNENKAAIGVLPQLPSQLFAKDLYSSKNATLSAGSLSPELASDNESDVDEDTFAATDDTTISLVRILLHSYFVIVRKHVQDLVPKAIMYLMISKVKRDLPSVLMGKILSHDKESGMDTNLLLQESESVREERVMKSKMCRMVKEALRVIEKDVRMELTN